MKTYSALAIVALTAGLSSPSRSEVVDDFEAYESEQIVGASAQSSPWFRVGVATIDNVTATANASLVIDGERSGHYLVRWPARFGSARYRFESPRDLSGYAGFSLMLKSDVADTQTSVRLLIGGRESIYLVKTAVPLSAEPARFAADFAAESYELVYGLAGFDEVLTHAEALGFQITNATEEGGAEVTELVVMDDLMLDDGSAEADSAEAEPAAEPQ